MDKANGRVQKRNMSISTDEVVRQARIPCCESRQVGSWGVLRCAGMYFVGVTVPFCSGLAAKTAVPTASPSPLGSAGSASGTKLRVINGQPRQAHSALGLGFKSCQNLPEVLPRYVERGMVPQSAGYPCHGAPGTTAVVLIWLSVFVSSAGPQLRDSARRAWLKWCPAFDPQARPGKAR